MTNWNKDAWRRDATAVVLDDLTDCFGAGAQPQPGSTKVEPLKAWTQRNTWTYRQLYKDPQPCAGRPVIIITNVRPDWLGLEYWKDNTTVVEFPRDCGPLWLDPASPEYKAFLDKRRGHVYD